MESVYTYYFLITWILMWAHHVCSGPMVPTVQEYCNMEEFVAQCGEDEVIVMETARYGRMRMNRCVTVDYGNLGCSSDERRHFDALCSGRQKCTVKIPDDDLYNKRPCPADIVSYLEASYSCMKVLSSRNLHRECKQKRRIELTQPQGIISSGLVEQEAGRHLCPILIHAAAGQRVNITLYDFGSAISRGSSTGRGGLQGSSVVCQRYALIKEPRSASPTIVCSGEQRTRGVYLSDGSTVEIQLVHTRHQKEVAHFLLEYSVTGCPNPKLGGHHLVDRNAERAIVRCNATGHQSTLVCTGSKWIGDLGNCTRSGGSWSVWGVLADDWSTPHGILITVGLGVALGIVIGVTLLVCVLLCLKRRRKASAEHSGGAEADDNLYGHPDYNVPPGHGQEKWGVDTVGGYPNTTLARDGHYTHGWSTGERRTRVGDPRLPVDALPTGGVGGQEDGGHMGGQRLNSFGQVMYDRTEHIYEKPS